MSRQIHINYLMFIYLPESRMCILAVFAEVPIARHRTHPRMSLQSKASKRYTISHTRLRYPSSYAIHTVHDSSYNVTLGGCLAYKATHRDHAFGLSLSLSLCVTPPPRSSTILYPSETEMNAEAAKVVRSRDSRQYIELNLLEKHFELIP